MYIYLRKLKKVKDPNKKKKKSRRDKLATGKAEHVQYQPEEEEPQDLITQAIDLPRTTSATETTYSTFVDEEEGTYIVTDELDGGTTLEPEMDFTEEIPAEEEEESPVVPVVEEPAVQPIFPVTQAPEGNVIYLQKLKKVKKPKKDKEKKKGTVKVDAIKQARINDYFRKN